MKTENTIAIIVGLAGAATVLSLFISPSSRLNAGLESYYMGYNTDPAAWNHGTPYCTWPRDFAYFCLVAVGVTGLVAVLLSRRFIVNAAGAASASFLADVALVLIAGAAMIGFLLLPSTQHQLPYFVNMVMPSKKTWAIYMILIIWGTIAATVWSTMVYTVIRYIKSLNSEVN